MSDSKAREAAALEERRVLIREVQALRGELRDVQRARQLDAGRADRAGPVSEPPDLGRRTSDSER